MITLINKTDENLKKYTAIDSITMVLGSDESLPEILEAFESFLKASGFVFDGKLEITERDSSPLAGDVLIENLKKQGDSDEQ